MNTPDEMDDFAKSLDGINMGELGLNDEFSNPTLGDAKGDLAAGGVVNGRWHLLDIDIDSYVTLSGGHRGTRDYPAESPEANIEYATITGIRVLGAMDSDGTTLQVRPADAQEFQKLVNFTIIKNDVFAKNLPIPLTDDEDQGKPLNLHRLAETLAEDEFERRSQY